MSEKKVLAVLKALSDETRLNIVEFLLDGDKCVCEIFPRVNRTQSTVSIQLAKLEKAGIVESRRQGKKIFYKIKDLSVCIILEALNSNKGKTLNKTYCMNKQRNLKK